MKKKSPISYKVTITAMLVVVLLTGSLLTGSCGTTRQDLATQPKQTAETTEKTFKVLHVMSYHAEWKWNRDQFNGFKDALNGLNVEYQVVEMDTKRHSSPEWIEQISQEARDLIDTWHPDLVYTNDDNAQEHGFDKARIFFTIFRSI